MKDYICESKHGMRVTEEFIIQRLDGLKKDYAETGDPVAVWIAIGLCPHIGERLPVWVQNYLTDVSADILECTQTKQMGKALGFTGRNLQKAVTCDINSHIALHVKQLTDTGMSRSDAISVAAEKARVGAKRVEKALTDCGFKLTP